MQLLKKRYLLALILLASAYVIPALAENPSQAGNSTPATQPATAPSAEEGTTSGTETIVFLRHGEKPPGGLGQLTPQGFNRAIALSKVLPEKFGKPDFIFAPDPADKVNDSGAGPYFYVRPLVTIEPTAIALGMQIQTPFGFRQITPLLDELTKPSYAKSLVFVAWEHVYEAKAVTMLVEKYGGNSADVPEWHGSDYDSLYIVRLTRTPGQPIKAVFTHEQEGLDHESKSMPAPAKP
uniref:Histidine phosphatase family protein n=1 Tax=uncultured organism TaxID=155900 RepID=A0A3G1QTF6_9ZZZZ|nr:hypothetical protein [uncultured organism]